MTIRSLLNTYFTIVGAIVLCWLIYKFVRLLFKLVRLVFWRIPLYLIRSVIHLLFF